jgi:outer membrane protein
MRLLPCLAAAGVVAAHVGSPTIAPLAAQGTDTVRTGVLATPRPGGPAVGPDSAGPVLTLDDALRLAHRNNPVFLQTLAARRAAGAGLRAAYGQLLPQASASLFGSYQQAGQSVVSGGFLGASSDFLQSVYGINLNYTVNASTLMTPGFERANRDAADADVAGQAETLQGNVAQQYVTVLEDQAKAALQDTLVADDQAQLELSRAKVSVGSATLLDQQRASVTVGQQQVQALQAHNLVDIDKLRLFQQLGVIQPPGVRLVDAFVVTMPNFTLDSVLTLARRANPQVNALRAREHAADVGVHRARGLYTPTLQVATGIGGYTFQSTNDAALIAQSQAAVGQQFSSCLSLDSIAQAAHLPPRNCGPSSLTPAQVAAIRAGNRQFPFSFQNLPRQVSATFSLPIFDGFQREQRVEQAQVDRENARYNERARELQLTADVTSAYLTLTTAVRTVEIQEQNAAAARQALALAEERYRVGAATFIDVTDSRAAFERAEDDRISAVYDYHKAFAALESTVGRPLR